MRTALLKICKMFFNSWHYLLQRDCWKNLLRLLNNAVHNRNWPWKRCIDSPHSRIVSLTYGGTVQSGLEPMTGMLLSRSSWRVNHETGHNAILTITGCIWKAKVILTEKRPKLTRNNETLIALSIIVSQEQADKIWHFYQSNFNRDGQKSEATSYKSVRDRRTVPLIV